MKTTTKTTVTELNLDVNAPAIEANKVQLAKVARAFKKLHIAANPTAIAKVVNAFAALNIEVKSKSSSWIARRLKMHTAAFTGVVAEPTTPAAVETPVVEVPATETPASEPAATTVKLTPKEKAMLVAIVQNEYRDGSPDLSAEIWSFSVAGTNSKAAILGSLTKKGLVRGNGDTGKNATIGLTPEGIAAYESLPKQ